MRFQIRIHEIMKSIEIQLGHLRSELKRHLAREYPVLDIASEN